MKVQPASIAAWMVAMDSASSVVTPYDWDIPMQPRPRLDTFRSPSWDSRMPRTYQLSQSVSLTPRAQSAPQVDRSAGVGGTTPAEHAGRIRQRWRAVPRQ